MEKDPLKTATKVLLIGGSAGSLEIILQIISGLDLPLKIAIVVVIHRRYIGEDSLTKLFSYKTQIPVTEIEDKQQVKPGTIYLAPVDYHILFEDAGTFALDVSEKVQYSRPSIDVAFQSAAEVYGEKLVCLLLSGANADGVEGLCEAAKAGAAVYVQSPESAAFPTMPEIAINRLKIKKLLEPEQMATFINSLS